ncbi:MAG: hypothetical protein ACRDN9_04290 [Streptosporangiaceae bacterium]
MAVDQGVDQGQQRMVDNPMRTRLEALKRDAERQSGAISKALDSAASKMASGDVWRGPAADSFDGELSKRAGKLKKLADQMVQDVDAVLKSTPKQIPYGSYRAMVHDPSYY